VPAFFELCEQYGLDINTIMADEYGIDLEGLKSKGDYKPGMTVAGQVPFNNPHESSNRFKGSVDLLIAKPTFSAASNFAAAVKFFEMGTLIGQETGGTKHHYGQVLPVQLPHSGLKGQVSTAHFIAVGGIEDRGGVKPDYEVRQTFIDKNKGRDTVLEFTLNLIKNGGLVSVI
jgi:C-terminal processing protease CtpA/Prc